MVFPSKPASRLTKAGITSRQRNNSSTSTSTSTSNINSTVIPWRLCTTSALVLIATWVVCVNWIEPFKDRSSTYKSLKTTHPSTIQTNQPSIILHPEVSIIASTKLFYMFPPTNNHTSKSDTTSTSTNANSTTKSAKGILIFFHGCNHGGQDFFFLPEDRLVARAALDRGLVVLSISSADRYSGCWSRSGDMVDLKKNFNAWRKQQQLPKTLPIIAMGASSGGSILFQAYKELPIRAMASYIASKVYTPTALQAPQTLPAIAYVYMPRDERSHNAMRDHVEPSLQQVVNGVPYKIWTVDPHPFTPHVCAERIPEMGLERCTDFLNMVMDVPLRMQSQLQQPTLPLMDSEYNILQPYTSGNWNSIFLQAGLDPPAAESESEIHPLSPTTKPRLQAAAAAADALLEQTSFDGHSWLWASMIEEIAVSYGRHEMTAEHCHEVLDWLMEQAGIV